MDRAGLCCHLFTRGPRKGLICGSTCKDDSLKCSLHSRAEIKCEHGSRKTSCIKCHGPAICEHNTRRTRCPECNGGSRCEHGVLKSSCKKCVGGSVCEHMKIRTVCSECFGGSRCEHNKIKLKCRICFMKKPCEHGVIRSKCGECESIRLAKEASRTKPDGWTKRCIHDVVKARCRICGAKNYCEHNKLRYTCRLCGGNDGKCEHGIKKLRCRDCGGSQICAHSKIKTYCNICDPIGSLKGIVSCRVRSALGKGKLKKSLEYVGCTVEELMAHLEAQFQEGMTWDNRGKWHIDHIVPVKYGDPTPEEVIARLHYTNLQPLWAEENLSKHNRFIGKKQGKVDDDDVGENNGGDLESSNEEQVYQFETNGNCSLNEQSKQNDFDDPCSM